MYPIIAEDILISSAQHIKLILYSDYKTSLNIVNRSHIKYVL